MDTNQFFDLTMLATLPGITAGVLLVVQFTKNIIDFIILYLCNMLRIPIEKFPTSTWVVIISEAMLFTVTYFTNGSLDVKTIFITSLNGLIVAGSGMKVFESMTKSNT